MMKTVVLLALVASVVAVHPNDPEFHARINSKATTWTAGPNPVWEEMHEAEIDNYLGLLSPSDLRFSLGMEEFPTEEAPEDYVPSTNFDSRDMVPNGKCDFAVRDQGRCGSCWAFGAAEAVTSRFCIATDGAHQDELSTQWLVSCDKYGNFGCRGGIPAVTFAYIATAGIPRETCLPYTSGTTGKSGKCPKACEDGSEPEKFKVKKTSIRVHNNEKSIQASLEAAGPVECGFTVYEDFLTYTKGIYKHTEGKAKGGHAVSMLGFGVSDEGTPYWLVVNSWSSNWGDKGYFKIARGENECGMESQCVSGIPAL